MKSRLCGNLPGKIKETIQINFFFFSLFDFALFGFSLFFIVLVLF